MQTSSLSLLSDAVVYTPAPMPIQADPSTLVMPTIIRGEKRKYDAARDESQLAATAVVRPLQSNTVDPAALAETEASVPLPIPIDTSTGEKPPARKRPVHDWAWFKSMPCTSLLDHQRQMMEFKLRLRKTYLLKYGSVSYMWSCGRDKRFPHCNIKLKTIENAKMPGTEEPLVRSFDLYRCDDIKSGEMPTHDHAEAEKFVRGLPVQVKEKCREFLEEDPTITPNRLRQKAGKYFEEFNVAAETFPVDMTCFAHEPALKQTNNKKFSALKKYWRNVPLNQRKKVGEK